MAPLCGFLNLDKPAGVTSRDVVNQIVRGLGQRQVGHAGTLDPAATGVLVVAVGPATRLVEYVQRQTKVYETTIRLGARSSTDDAEGSIEELAVMHTPPRDAVERAAAVLVGTIQQVPPAVSALKVDGRRAHERVRAGETVLMVPRPVTVYRFDVQSYEYPWVVARVVCGQGTYVRSLARDLGASLGTGGLVERLRRTAVGSFVAEAATDPRAVSVDTWGVHRVPLESGLSALPSLRLDDDAIRRFVLGQRFQTEIATETDRGDAPEWAAFDAAGTFVGIARPAEEDGLFRPVKGGFFPCLNPA